MPAKSLLALLLFAAAPVTAQATTPPPFKPFTAEEHDRYLTRGKQVMTWFLAGQADSIVAVGAPEFVTLERVRELMDAFAERTGAVSRVLAEKLTRRNGAPQFWWEAEVVNFTAEPVVLRWVFDPEGRVAGVGFNPKSRALSDPEG